MNLAGCNQTGLTNKAALTAELHRLDMFAVHVCLLSLKLETRQKTRCGILMSSFDYYFYLSAFIPGSLEYIAQPFGGVCNAVASFPAICNCIVK